MVYIAFDTETTGVEPGSRMIELAAVAFDENGFIDQFETLVDPDMPIPKDTTKIHGITDDMVAGKPGTATALRAFFDWLPSKNLIAHFAKYDTGIVSWEAKRCGISLPNELTVIDTHYIARKISETENNKLATLADSYSLKRHGKDHRALSDSHLCAEYFRLMQPRTKPFGPGVRVPLIQLPWEKAGHEYYYTDDFPFWKPQLSMLPELVKKAKPLKFSYKDAKDNVTERTITPYGWAMKKNIRHEAHDLNGRKTGFIFHGWCHMLEARRTFKMGIVAKVNK